MKAHLPSQTFDKNDYNKRKLFHESFSHNNYYAEDENLPQIVQPNGNRLLTESEDEEEYDVEMNDYSGVEDDLNHSNNW